MEVHQQHCIQYSGDSSHFYPIDFTGDQHDPTLHPILVDCANKVGMVSLAEDIIHFNKVPLASKKKVSQVQRNFGSHC